MRLAAELEQRPPELVILTLSPQWMRTGASRGQRTWPARLVYDRLLGLIHQSAAARRVA